MKSISAINSARTWRRTALALALGLSLAGASNVLAQSNASGSIFGTVEGNQGGSTITINSPDTGFTRSTTVDAQGRYSFGSLPVGQYNVTLSRDGATVAVHEHVKVMVSAGTNVSFDGAAKGNATNLGTISVSANALPTIDVSSMDTRTVMTAEQLQELPVARSVSAVALLAPGVIQGSSYNAPSFGGSAASENAYYINGYQVTNPLTSIGFSTLPFDAISQEEVLTGGYSAEFGRSTGGVINIVTKRGTNTWKAGVYTIWAPESLRSDPHNINYANTGFYGPNNKTPTDGKLYLNRNRAQYWTSTVGAYFSGALIKDKLFFYLDLEQSRQEGNSVRYYTNSSAANLRQGWNDYAYKMPRWIAKVDWNINDSNLLELTGISDKTQYEAKYSPYSYTSDTHGSTQTGGAYTKDGGEVYVGKYTSYVTDDLTVTALYGTQKINHVSTPWGYDPACPYISSTTQSQAPGLTYTSCQLSTSTILVPGANDKTYGGRLDVEYRIGDHDIRVGLDQQTAESLTGSSLPGSYGWYYSWQANPNQAIDASHGVSSPSSAGGLGTQGYYVYRSYNTQLANVKTKQEAQYIEDRWQLTDRWLLSLGLRNEQFTNYNGDGQPYARQRHQLAPRVGFSWDVLGDSSLKVFANAGRYHLAMPNNVAVRGASGSLITSEYFTYTGIDPRTGAPTGLTSVAVNKSKGYTCGGTNAVSTNLECGESPDPRTVAAKDLKSHFQDEYILGAEYQPSASYVVGARATVRKLRSAIDDTCTQALGGSCYLFNPGQANTFLEEQADGSFKAVTYSNAQLGFPRLKRKYASLDLFIEHPFADNWYGKIDYTYSHNYGNTEGQLASDLDTGSGGQTDVSATQDWDLPQLMVGANGSLPNDRKHQLRAYGFYKFSPQWRVGANLSVASGRPLSCTSYWPDATAPGLYNGPYYHYCGLPIAGSTGYVYTPRGTSGRTPWTYKLDLNVAYTPGWMDNKLTLQMDIFNILNRQTALYYNTRYATNRSTVNPLYMRVLNYSDPRAVRFTARYDF
ncbi:TonB-dependent receptor [Dyella sp. 20L07]|uniref:TonB-dependent receptor n=1 Tax=Dyella sp. 20L07 TaxID=3384240 RepID=UPI003D2A192B